MSCPHCAARQLSPRDFAIGRTLRAVGVDMLSLPERAATLSAAQREAFAATFDEQRRVIAVRVAELRVAEKYLLSKGHSLRYEDSAICRMPMSPEALGWYGITKSVEGADDVALLQQVVEKLEDHYPSPLLAVIALVKLGKASPRDSRRLLYVCDTDMMGIEALYALASWRARGNSYLDRWHLRRILEVAKKVFDESPPWRVHMAVVLSRWHHGELPPYLSAALREGLMSADDDLRFECALALGDESELKRAVASADPEKAKLARTTLARTGSVAVADLVAGGTEEERRDVLRSLRAIENQQTASALFDLAATGTDEDRQRITRLVVQTRFDDTPAEVRDAVESWAQGSAPKLSAEEKLKLFDWAVNPQEYGLKVRTGAHVQAFVRLAQEAVRAAESRASLVESSEFARLIVRWQQQDLPFFKSLLDNAETAKALFKQIFYVHQAVDERADASTLLFALWDSADDKAALAGPISEAASGGLGRREKILAEFWKRPEGALLRAFDAWRGDLWYDARERMPDVFERLRLFMSAGGRDVYREVSSVWEQIPPDRAEEFFDLVFDYAMSVVATRPRTAVAVAYNGANVLANRYRAAPTPENEHLAKKLRERTWALDAAFKDAKPENDSEGGAANLLEDFHTLIRLCGEAKEQREEQQRREEERRQRDESRQREAEARRLEAERMQREAAEMQARIAEQQRIAKEQADAMAAKVREALGAQRKSDGPLQPQIPAVPIDSEQLLPGTPLPTLVDYVRFMKEMSSGGDMMKLLDSKGMSIATWPVVAQGWAAVLTSRMDAGMRFGALMAAPWA